MARSARPGRIPSDTVARREPGPARVGRPRTTPKSTDLPPAEEILLHAGTLFARHGFAGTSTRRIAEAAGIQQSTLFHYFPTKIDILRTLSERALQQPLEVVERLVETDETPSVKLYAAVHFHTQHLCSEPLALGALLQQPVEVSRKEFRGWLERTERYTHLLTRFIEDGVTTGEFIDCEPFVRTMGILGMCNNAIRWYKKGGRLTPAQVADEFARTIVRALLADPGTLPEIEARAAARP